MYGEVTLFSKKWKRGKNKKRRGSTSSEHKARELQLVTNRLSEVKCSIGNEARNRFLMRQHRRSQPFLQRVLASDVDEVGEEHGVEC